MIIIICGGIAVFENVAFDRSTALARLGGRTGCGLPAMLCCYLPLLTAAMAALVTVAVIIMRDGDFSCFSARIAGFIAINGVSMLAIFLDPIASRKTECQS